MDSLQDLGYTSPKRWYDDAFLQDADTSGSGNAPTQAQVATGQSCSESGSGNMNIGVAETSPNSQTEPLQKRPKLDSSDSDVDVTSISMPTCLNEPVQGCSSSQSVTQSQSDVSSNAHKQTLAGSDTKSAPVSVESKTEEKELSKQDTSTDSKSDKDGSTGQDIGKNKKEKLEDEQTKMKLVCKVVLRS